MISAPSSYAEGSSNVSWVRDPITLVAVQGKCLRELMLSAAPLELGISRKLVLARKGEILNQKKSAFLLFTTCAPDWKGEYLHWERCHAVLLL